MNKHNERAELIARLRDYDNTTIERNRKDMLQAAAMLEAQPAREWVGLSDEEIAGIVREAGKGSAPRPMGSEPTSVRIARAIESKLREKNAGLPAVAPDGYVLVPVEPTDDMLNCAQDRVYSLFRVDACSIWDAMLAAAPKPQATTPDDHPLMHSKPAPVFDLESLETGEADAR